MERNRRWRARREDSAAEKKDGNKDEDEDEEEKDEKEKRKRKNKEWRERRSTSNSQVIFSHFQMCDIFSEQHAIFKENLPNQKLFPG